MTRILSGSLLCSLLALMPGLSAAQSLDPSALVKVDVVDGWTTQDGTRMVGLRLRMADGWKTYWRSPGDAGVPPHFDWSGSRNLAAVRVHWPRPEIFDSFGQRTIGYSGEVVLPVELIPQDRSRPIDASGRAELGVCRDICVAVSAGYDDEGFSAPDAIRSGLASQPSRKPAGAMACKLTPIDDGMRLTATLSVSPQGRNEMTVIELMQSEVWVSEPETTRNGSRLTMVADIVPPEAAPFALDRSQLRITVLGDKGAAEVVGCAAG